MLKTDAVTPANSRQYVYDGAGHLLGEYTLAGTAVKEYVWLDDTLIAILSNFDGSTYQYVETDHLGTPRAVVHPTENTILWRWDLTPTAFGEHLPNGNPDGDAFTYTLNLRYPGPYFDAESGLHYNYFRDYEPATGRYIESDPIGLAGGPSTYAYVGAQPLARSDALGLEPHLYKLPIKGMRGHRGFSKNRHLSDSDRAMFAAAVQIARKKLKDCKCTCPSVETGHCFREDDRYAVQEMLEETDFYYDGTGYSFNPGTGERYEPYGARIYQSAFTNGVDSLAALLVHEANHRTGRDFSEEPGSYHIDKTCFGLDHYYRGP